MTEIIAMLRERGVDIDDKTLTGIFERDRNRTHPLPGAEAVIFDYLFNRRPHFRIARMAYMIVIQLRNLRAEDARNDHIVNMIEIGESLYAEHRECVTGFAAAMLDHMLGVTRYSRVLPKSKWRSKDRVQALQLLEEASASIMRSIEALLTDDRDLVVSLLAEVCENLVFVASEIDQREHQIDFDNNLNPRTKTLAVLKELKEWQAFTVLWTVAVEAECLGAAYNLAEYRGPVCAFAHAVKRLAKFAGGRRFLAQNCVEHANGRVVDVRSPSDRLADSRPMAAATRLVHKRRPRVFARSGNKGLHGGDPLAEVARAGSPRLGFQKSRHGSLG